MVLAVIFHIAAGHNLDRQIEATVEGVNTHQNGISVEDEQPQIAATTEGITANLLGIIPYYNLQNLVVHKRRGVQDMDIRGNVEALGG